jgi:hypothetical protein
MAEKRPLFSKAAEIHPEINASFALKIIHLLGLCLDFLSGSFDTLYRLTGNHGLSLFSSNHRSV